MASGGRRQFVVAAASALALVPVAAWLKRPAAHDRTESLARAPHAGPSTRSDAEWRASLSRQEYAILRQEGTERPYSSPLNGEKRAGRFVCAGCAQPLFSSSTKFESGTGWPSFWEPLEGAVGTRVDRGWLSVRTEVHCARCGGHLGHVFPDGPRPTGLRYCMNGVALRFEARA